MFRQCLFTPVATPCLLSLPSLLLCPLFLFPSILFNWHCHNQQGSGSDFTSVQLCSPVTCGDMIVMYVLKGEVHWMSIPHLDSVLIPSVL
ncbi:hypothetical protein BDV10DRAFT_178862 [Aspergillus recurvatus]